MKVETLELGEEETKDFTMQWKQGVRVLGISESFQKTDDNSIVAGVVMRGDGRIDGFGICRPKIGGLDATERLLEMFNRIGIFHNLDDDFIGLVSALAQVFPSYDAKVFGCVAIFHARGG